MRDRFLTRDERIMFAGVMIGFIAGSAFVLAAQAIGEML